MLVVVGASMMAVFATVTSLVQLITTNQMRGRVMSVYNCAFRGGMPMGNLATGWLVPRFTVPWSWEPTAFSWCCWHCISCWCKGGWQPCERLGENSIPERIIGQRSWLSRRHGLRPGEIAHSYISSDVHLLRSVV